MKFQNRFFLLFFLSFALVVALAALTARLAWAVLPGPAAQTVPSAPKASMATYTVDITDDEDDGSCAVGDCSLREAIAAASAGDTVNFGLTTPATITLTLGELSITETLTINGPGASQLAVSGNSASRVFTITSGIAVTVAGLTIRDGDTGYDHGGGIYNAGILTLDTSTVSGNTTLNWGGGIYNGGTLTLTHSTVSGNSANSSGGGVYNVGTLTLDTSTISGNSAGSGGGIYNGGTLTLIYSTISGNSANSGGGIHNTYGSTLSLDSSTVSGNSASSGGGIYNASALTLDTSTISGNSASTGFGGGIRNVGTLTLTHGTVSTNSAYSGGGISHGGGTSIIKNSLIGDNSASSSSPDCSGTLISQDYNLVENTAGCTINGTATYNITGQDPQLGPLQDNGGETWTHALEPGSPVIDRIPDGVNGCGVDYSHDQRNRPRPYPSAGACDIGAYEKGPLGLAKTVTPDTNVSYQGVVTYTVVLSNASALDDTSVFLTDTLPGRVHFARWIDVPPPGASVTDDEITWSGVVTAYTAITFTFQATHTGGYRDHVLNTARFSGTLEAGGASASFDVECALASTVQNAADSGPGSLRQALVDVCAGGTIDFALVNPATITLTNGKLTIDKDLTILGPGASQLAVRGGSVWSVFDISSGTTVNIAGLTIHDGHGPHGGGIRNVGTLTLDASIVSGNSAYDPMGLIGAYGGGIYNAGTLTLTHSTVSGNGAEHGGGIDNAGTLTLIHSTVAGNTTYTTPWFEGTGGGIYNTGTLALIHSTVASNTAPSTSGGYGGGIYNLGTLTLDASTVSGNLANRDGGGIRNVGTLTLTHSTVSGNSADGGGGISHGGGTSIIKNSLIGDNSASSSPDCSGTLTSQDYNLVENTTGCIITGTATYNITGQDPQLGPLQDNGGETWTHALLAGSLAIDHIPYGTNGCGTDYAQDQRGFSRPCPSGGACDVGAYEVQPLLALSKAVTPDTNVPYRGVVTYTIVLSNAGALGDNNVLLTDTLPSQVDFARWLGAPPLGASVMDDEITWSGVVTAYTAITFTFQVTHAGSFGDVVTNTAQFSGAMQTGSAQASYTVRAPERLFLPMVFKNH